MHTNDETEQHRAFQNVTRLPIIVCNTFNVLGERLWRNIAGCEPSGKAKLFLEATRKGPYCYYHTVVYERPFSHKTILWAFASHRHSHPWGVTIKPGVCPNTTNR